MPRVAARLYPRSRLTLRQMRLRGPCSPLQVRPIRRNAFQDHAECPKNDNGRSLPVWQGSWIVPIRFRHVRKSGRRIDSCNAEHSPVRLDSAGSVQVGIPCIRLSSVSAAHPRLVLPLCSIHPGLCPDGPGSPVAAQTQIPTRTTSEQHDTVNCAIAGERTASRATAASRLLKSRFHRPVYSVASDRSPIKALTRPESRVDRVAQHP